MATQKFNTGKLFATKAVDEAMYKSGFFATFCQISLSKHKSGNWGDLGEEDKESNEEALKNGGRLLSSYNINDEVKNIIKVNESRLWIITEHDRSVTTILFPTYY